MLTEEEKNYLYEKVVAALRVGEPRSALLAIEIPTELIDRIPNSFNTPALITQEIIRLCMADRWNHEPCRLLLLFKLFPAEAYSQRLADRMKVPPAYGGDPAKARVLANDSPFLNRESLRTRAVLLAADRPARPILLVSGGEQSGKSYSYDFIDHLFVTNKVDFKPLRVRFEKDDGMLFGPEQLAREILMGMGVEVDELSPTFFATDTNQVRWLQNLAGRVLTKKPAGNRYLIILDNFFGNTLPTETAKFIDALARRIVDSAEFSQSFRLVLLHFDRTQLTVESRKVDGENIAQINDVDVTEGAREIYGRYGGIADEALLKETVAEILNGMGAQKNLAELNGRLQLLIDTLKS